MLILLPDPTAATSQLYPGDRLIVAYGVLPNHNDSVTHTEHDQYGMISMEKSIASLVTSGLVTVEDGLKYSAKPGELRRLIDKK